MIVKQYEEILGLDPLRQFLINRGISIEEVDNYLAANLDSIAPPEMLGEDKLKRALEIIAEAVVSNQDIYCCIDCDFDGYSSTALLLNYLHKHFPHYTENHIKYSHHFGKAHGLSDVIDEALNYKYVIILDAGSNDIDEHRQLLEQGSKLIIADHHEVDITPIENDNLVLINNQYSNYPNKALCGAGITWLLCKYFDKIMKTNYAMNYLDLAGFANMIDMMDIRNKETKAMMFAGMQSNAIKNPFFSALVQKNEYSLSGSDYMPAYLNNLEITPIGVGFFVGPYVNAVTRSGTQEEKQLIFESMLEWKAFQKVPSTKRGEKGKEEYLVTQAVRTIGNVKRHQDELVKNGMQLLENKIAENDMLKHNILIFTLEQDEIPSSIAGLAANKIMNKYGKCTSVLTHGDDNLYIGSSRGCNVSSYKNWLEESNLTEFTAGHSQAFGTSIKEENIEKLIEYGDKDEQIASPQVLYVDYYWSENEIDNNIILELTKSNDYIGTGISRPKIYINNLEITEDKVQILGSKMNTLKINTSNGVSIMKFGIEEEDINNLIGKKVNLICKPNKNEWMNNISAQLIIEDIDIIDDLSIVNSWSF